MKKLLSLLVICVLAITIIPLSACGDAEKAAEEKHIQDTLAVVEDMHANSTGEFLFMKKNPRSDESFKENYITISGMFSSVATAHRSVYEKCGIDYTKKYDTGNPFDNCFERGDEIVTYRIQRWPDLAYVDGYLQQMTCSDPSVSVYGICAGKTREDIDVCATLQAKGFELQAAYVGYEFTAEEVFDFTFDDGTVEYDTVSWTYTVTGVSNRKEAALIMQEYCDSRSNYSCTFELTKVHIYETYAKAGIVFTIHFSEDGKITKFLLIAPTTNKENVIY